MAMKLISEQVLASTAASVTFSNIPQTYRDLVVEFTGNVVSSSVPRLRFNSDTSNASTNYSNTFLIGYGAGTYTTNLQNNSGIFVGGWFNTWPVGTTVVATNTVNIVSYANSSLYKSCLSRGSDASSEASAFAGTWRSTAAITAIVVTNGGTGDFNAGTSFRLWGVS